MKRTLEAILDTVSTADADRLLAGIKTDMPKGIRKKNIMKKTMEKCGLGASRGKRAMLRLTAIAACLMLFALAVILVLPMFLDNDV